jgi:WhiB family transcriptional regulator, redox-sensing transcriptional regulator
VSSFSSHSRPSLTLVSDPYAAPIAVQPFGATEWYEDTAWDDEPAWNSTPAWEEPETTKEAWRLDALCAETDPEAFFPEKGGSTRDAKRVCTGCPVRAQCLEFALENDERFGIWGGLSERERRRVRLERSGRLSA